MTANDDNPITYTGYESAFVPTPMGDDVLLSQVTTRDNRGNVTVTGNAPNVRRWNPLGEFSSYTYQISLYMITPDAYDAFVASGRQDITVLNSLNAPCDGGGAYLIAQSGGINDTSSRRAEGFQFDYYIDNLKMKGAVNPSSPGAPVFDFNMQFTIIEPYGFSFMTNLKKATDAIAKYSKVRNMKEAADNMTRQFFVLGLKFLGYDKDGNLIESSGQTYQRYFDILIKELKFKIDGRAVVYNITATPIPIKEGTYTKRGLIDKAARNLTGATVGEVLSALETKLNNDQSNYDIKIKYSITYLGEDGDTIKNALFVSPADVQKAKWPMAKLQSQVQGNAATAQKSPPDANKRIISFEVGTPIVQAISQVVTQSRYMIDALKTVFKPTNEPNDKTNDYPNVELKTEQTVKWINISPKVSNPRWDKSRNDWVWDIEYQLKTYDTPMIVNPAYVDKIPKYYGPHKRYRYWYTGENSEIIKYEQTFNNSFYNTVLDPNYSLNVPSPVASVGDKRTGGPKTGETGVGLEAQLSYVTTLYEPGAWASAKIEILGDPDLLAYPLTSGDPNQYNPFYQADGVTMNPLSGQVFIEIDFVEAVDYNHVKGTMDINESIMFWKYPPELAGKIKGVSYMIREIDHNFRNGKFTQDLDLVVNTYFQEYEKTANERETADAKDYAQQKSNIDNENARFANRAKTNQPTGFVKDQTPANKTAGGDPCAVVPTNQAPLSSSIDDDTMTFLTSEPAQYSNLSDIGGA